MKYPLDLFVALLHPVSRRARPLVVIGGGIHGLDLHACGRPQRIGNRKLIVDLVVRVGIDNRADLSLRRRKPLLEGVLSQKRSSPGRTGGGKETTSCWFVHCSYSTSVAFFSV
jgi:hypothetical protein